MSFLMFLLSVILAVLAWRLRGWNRVLVQMGSLILLIYFLHNLHVF